MYNLFYLNYYQLSTQITFYIMQKYEKLKLRYLNLNFGKTQVNGDLGIGCDKFFKNLFALRPCFQATNYLPITKGLHLMMITYNVYIQNIQYKFNLYILRLLSKLFPQECYNKTKIVALFKSIYFKILIRASSLFHYFS